ncbi:hypothetical protein K437DRAFT_256448 [Tilletiaria anomala UBC 951]|uniref:Uncharacterized protein n=1 Tax=Tilletiaria anomala (strain ATCC 24038 / CBS 436.72 / UBC 951) TaxID=1037660 RepID=A0A066VVH3_TILAU|nr:uncharacterized protein K437DRAFT_256448 [Tilletiaria anomala UBC 951]KDN45727.1 hypothetical protein K437DRAFT_256448 [Tilletiaria anomala UBC 951]
MPNTLSATLPPYLTALCPDLGIISVFPRTGWLSFVVFVLVYGQFMARSDNGKLAIGINATLAVIFALMFVCTRISQFGNLSTDCLRTPAQSQRAASANRFLSSVQSFLYTVKYPTFAGLRLHNVSHICPARPHAADRGSQ